MWAEWQADLSHIVPSLAACSSSPSSKCGDVDSVERSFTGLSSRPFHTVHIFHISLRAHQMLHLTRGRLCVSPCEVQGMHARLESPCETQDPYRSGVDDRQASHPWL